MEGGQRQRTPSEDGGGDTAEEPQGVRPGCPVLDEGGVYYYLTAAVDSLIWGTNCFGRREEDKYVRFGASRKSATGPGVCASIGILCIPTTDGNLSLFCLAFGPAISLFIVCFGRDEVMLIGAALGVFHHFQACFSPFSL